MYDPLPSGVSESSIDECTRCRVDVPASRGRLDALLQHEVLPLRPASTHRLGSKGCQVMILLITFKGNMETILAHTAEIDPYMSDEIKVAEYHAY